MHTEKNPKLLAGQCWKFVYYFYVTEAEIFCTEFLVNIQLYGLFVRGLD